MNDANKFVVFSKITGAITSTGTSDMPEWHETEENGVLIGVTADIENSYVDKTQVKPKGEKPTSFHVFDYSTKQWEDPRTLQDFKDAQWLLIKQARKIAINTDLVTPYGVFDSDEGSRKAVTDAVLMLQTLASMGTPTTIDFTLADNTVVTMSTPQMVEVGLLLGQKTQTAYSQARIKRENIDAATTKESVLLISW